MSWLHEVSLTKEEITLLCHACQREMEFFHGGELKKRNTLMEAYQKLLKALTPE